MTGKEILVNSLNLTNEEWGHLADYAYADRFYPNEQTVSEWQQRQLEAMMEEEMMEMEMGEPLWEPGVKNKLISIFNRPVRSL